MFTQLLLATCVGGVLFNEFLEVAAAAAVRLGPVELVRNSSLVNCGPSTIPPVTPGPYKPQRLNLDIPDEPCRAWKDASGAVTMLSTHTDARLDHGPSLSAIKHDCKSVFNSTWNPDPSFYDDRTWLMSPWLPNASASTVYALSHMEFHGWSDTPGHQRCIDESTGAPVQPRKHHHVEPSLCWYNAIVLLKSVDGGETFHHALPPPHHMVAAAPYRYPDYAEVAMGLGDMSNVLLARDGFLYVFANSRRDYKAMKAGHCLMRTTPAALGDPRSWRGWGGGTEFNVTFVNPYLANITDPSAHVCQPLDIGFAPHYVGWSSYFGRYIAVGTGIFRSHDGQGASASDGAQRQAAMFSLSKSPDSLLDWSEPTLLRWNDPDPQVKEAYPTLLDEVASAGSPNIDRVGKESGYLYYMHSTHCAELPFGCRNIRRQKVMFE